MKYLYIIFILLTFSGCIHTITNDDIKNSYNIPNNFRNASYIDKLNDNKSNLLYKDPITEIKTMLPDDDFIAILDIATKENPDLLILLSKIKQARYKVKSATSDIFPQVKGSLDYSYQENSDGLNGNLNFSWEVDIYGKIDALRKSEKELLKYAEENYINGQVTLYADVATYYFTLKRASAQLFLANKILKNYETIRDVYQKLYKIGLVNETDYLNSSLNYLNGQNNVQKYSIEVEKNKNALYELMNNNNIDISQDFIDKPFITPIIPKIQDIPLQVILNRPDVRASVYILNSELYKHYNRKMALLPSLSLNGSLGQLLASSTGIGDLVWQIGASLMSPLLNRQQLYSQLRIQEETVKQSELELQKSINIARSDIENASFAVYSSNKTYINTKDILKSAEISMQILETRWKNGLIDDVAYLDAQNDFLNTYISFYNAWHENISSSISLYKAFGGSFSPEVH